MFVHQANRTSSAVLCVSSAGISPCAFFVLSSRPVYSTAERSTGRFKLFYLLLMSGRVGLGRVLRYVVTLRYVVVTLCRVVLP